jgi:4-carboxymuconolactone decarboxylase
LLSQIQTDPLPFVDFDVRLSENASAAEFLTSSRGGEDFMNIRLSMLLLAALPLVAQAQNTLPPDIDPVTLSRLPPVTAQDLDEEGRRLLAARTNFTPGPGPTHITIYSPRERDLGIPSGEKSPVGPRYFQLAVLITAREIDQQYEWSAHEPAGLRQGLEQSVIDVVKNNTEVAGLSDKDATMINFGRALFREHRVSSELWQKMVNHFGRQHTVQIMAIMGDYFRVGFMLNAVDQHLPPGRKALLPPSRR